MVWNLIGNIRGRQGTRGSLWFQSSSTPWTATFTEPLFAGDMYLNTTTDMVYRFLGGATNSSTNWQGGSDLTGRTGATGAGIDQIIDNEDGTFTITFTDGRPSQTFVIPSGGGDGVGNVPIGAILMWATNDPIPSGFAICDGTNGTPDLRQRFIRGNTVAGGIGGTNLHHHNVFSHTIRGTRGSDEFTTGFQGETTNNIPDDILPPYYDVIFIQRIS